MGPYTALSTGLIAGVIVCLPPAMQLNSAEDKDNSLGAGLGSVLVSFIAMHIFVFIYNKFYHDTIALFAGAMVFCYLGCLGALCLRNRKIRKGLMRKE